MILSLTFDCVAIGSIFCHFNGPKVFRSLLAEHDFQRAKIASETTKTILSYGTFRSWTLGSSVLPKLQDKKKHKIKNQFYS